jgi:hypothetical protein
MLCLIDAPRKSAMKITGYATIHFLLSEGAKKKRFCFKKSRPAFRRFGVSFCGFHLKEATLLWIR